MNPENNQPLENIDYAIERLCREYGLTARKKEIDLILQGEPMTEEFEDFLRRNENCQIVIDTLIDMQAKSWQGIERIMIGKDPVINTIRKLEYLKSLRKDANIAEALENLCISHDAIEWLPLLLSYIRTGKLSEELENALEVNQKVQKLMDIIFEAQIETIHQVSREMRSSDLN